MITANWQRIEEFQKVIFESPLAQYAAFLLKATEIRFFHEHIFYKLKGHPKKNSLASGFALLLCRRRSGHKFLDSAYSYRQKQ